MNAPARRDNKNQQLLAEVNAAGAWFHAKKVHPVWAKRAEISQELDTLEGREKVKAGDYLCRGPAGELWPQKESSFLSKYNATDEMDAEGWRKYTPKPDAQGVMAAQLDHPFQVSASWGELTGKAGDYLVKNFADKAIEFPDDVWIVDQTIFLATYARVEQ